MNRYFLSLFEFDGNAVDPNFAADILLETFEGDKDQLDQLLDTLLSEEPEPESGLELVETLELTTDEMGQVVTFINELRNSETEE